MALLCPPLCNRRRSCTLPRPRLAWPPSLLRSRRCQARQHGSQSGTDRGTSSGSTPTSPCQCPHRNQEWERRPGRKTSILLHGSTAAAVNRSPSARPDFRVLTRKTETSLALTGTLFRRGSRCYEVLHVYHTIQYRRLS